jgi:hypothetical protein
MTLGCGSRAGLIVRWKAFGHRVEPDAAEIPERKSGRCTSMIPMAISFDYP